MRSSDLTGAYLLEEISYDRRGCFAIPYTSTGWCLNNFSILATGTSDISPGGDIIYWRWEQLNLYQGGSHSMALWSGVTPIHTDKSHRHQTLVSNFLVYLFICDSRLPVELYCLNMLSPLGDIGSFCSMLYKALCR